MGTIKLTSVDGILWRLQYDHETRMHLLEYSDGGMFWHTLLEHRLMSDALLAWSEFVEATC